MKKLIFSNNIENLNKVSSWIKRLNIIYIKMNQISFDFKILNLQLRIDFIS